MEMVLCDYLDVEFIIFLRNIFGNNKEPGYVCYNEKYKCFYVYYNNTTLERLMKRKLKSLPDIIAIGDVLAMPINDFYFVSASGLFCMRQDYFSKKIIIKGYRDIVISEMFSLIKEEEPIFYISKEKGYRRLLKFIKSDSTWIKISFDALWRYIRLNYAYDIELDAYRRPKVVKISDSLLRKMFLFIADATIEDPNKYFKYQELFNRFKEELGTEGVNNLFVFKCSFDVYLRDYHYHNWLYVWIPYPRQDNAYIIKSALEQGVIIDIDKVKLVYPNMRPANVTKTIRNIGFLTIISDRFMMADDETHSLERVAKDISYTIDKLIASSPSRETTSQVALKEYKKRRVIFPIINKEIKTPLFEAIIMKYLGYKYDFQYGNKMKNRSILHICDISH
ncbi:MAG: hypothetical protein IJ247_00780 [Bacilli bacterium]|nr:hypothetical protein [Bacilli bacterium]